jgi:hypothetical protein
LIKQRLQHFFLKDPAKPLYWIALGLLVKCLPFLLLLLHHPPSDIPGTWGGSMNDTHSYFDPIENLLHNGSYSPDFRMPGYGFIYFLFRLLFSQAITCNCIIALQFILAGVSAYYLALTAKAIFKSNKIFYVCYYLFLLSVYSNYFDGWLLTESFSCSALIFSSWLFVSNYYSGKTGRLLYSGLFLTWAVFLRPVFLPLFLVFLFILVFSTNQKKLRLILIFVLPFLFFEGAWIARNYIIHGRIIPLSNSYMAPQEDTTYIMPLREFIRSWGGSADFADNSNYLPWFGFHFKDTPMSKEYSGKLPDYIYTSQFNLDSLLKLKKKIIALNDSLLPAIKINVYQKELIAKFSVYTASVKHEHPILYYFEAPLFHCLPRFLFGNESKIYMKRFQLPGKAGILTETFFTLFYFIVIILGSISALVLFFMGFRKNKAILIIATIPLYTIIIHALVLRLTDNRYLMPAWAFLIVCASYFIVFLIERNKNSA